MKRSYLLTAAFILTSLSASAMPANTDQLITYLLTSKDFTQLMENNINKDESPVNPGFVPSGYSELKIEKVSKTDALVKLCTGQAELFSRSGSILQVSLLKTSANLKEDKTTTKKFYFYTGEKPENLKLCNKE